MARTKAQIRKAKARNRAQISIMDDTDRQSRRNGARADPQHMVKAARDRHTSDIKCDLLHPMLHHPCGQVIASLASNEGEAHALWSLFDGMDRADDTYMRQVIGRQRHAKVSKIEFHPETFEARDDDQPDLRTEDERHRDAVNGAERWRGIRLQMGRQDRVLLIGAMRGLADVHRDGKATGEGRSFMRAMRALRGVDERGQAHGE